ncbi:MAG: transcription-repair coupling factor [Nannocystaceae bacterium]
MGPDSLSPHAAAAQVARAARAAAPLRVLGADGALRAHVIAAAVGAGVRVLAVTVDDAAARTLASDVAFFLGLPAPDPDDAAGEIVVLPDLDTSPLGDLAPDARTVAARLAVLGRCAFGQAPSVMVAGVRALWRKSLPRAGFELLRQRWTTGSEIGFAQAQAQLLAAGYVRADVVEDPGSFAVRGGVLDVFTPALAQPVRLEFFGDEIERMRSFDVQSQRTERALEALELVPVKLSVPTTAASLRARVLELADGTQTPTSRARQVIDALEGRQEFFGVDAIAPLLHDGLSPAWEYLAPDTRVVVDEPAALVAAAAALHEELEAEHARALADRRLVSPPSDHAVEPEALAAWLVQAWAVLERLERPDDGDGRTMVRLAIDRDETLAAELQAARSRRSGELLAPVLARVAALGPGDDAPPWSVVFASPNHSHAERLVALLRDHGVAVDPPRDVADAPALLRPPTAGPRRVAVVAGELSSGFRSDLDRVVVFSEADVFGQLTHRSKPRRRRGGVAGLGQLAVGDYVVHVTHGVGRYVGLVQLALGGTPADYVQVEYAGTDRLYLPVTRLDEIERYVSAESKPPKLDKMGGLSFASKTAKVKAEVRQIAEELLQIYAQREAIGGHAHPDGGEPYREFEATFPFEETPDQADAIEAVQKDLSRAQPMDRLICGDVGFGKTEVALRAAFRVAHGGKQVAVLAPTTVLVQQHYHTFRERLAPFGLEVGVLSRFTDAKTRANVIAGAKNRSIDVVVGTHRLLSTDVRFADLGLVVIDEEQRFGVAQKERFKKLKTEVDVLSMSATPIPRTLHLSLLGIREISLVMTPPGDRLAVRTFVTRPSDTVLRDGVSKELARGGQVFYVVPRIMGIEEHATRLRKLVPGARVRVAHGQMPAEMLEQAMVALVEHEIDVLVSTTIIESGLDIPRANTMFVADADHFGLAQLYQLRGRIGRSRHRAFCYLLVESLEKLQPDARRRLEALARYAELGSGFSVASHDLEIRGAGDILGARQSGQIQAVGFEAYSRILTEAVAELRGQPILRESDPELAFDVPAYLPDSYIDDTGTRLDLYRRLSVAHDRDTIAAIVDEIRDRFGELPPEARCLEHVMACKSYGRRLHATAIELRGERLGLRLAPTTALPPELAAKLSQQTRGRMKLVGPDRIAVRIEGAGDEQRLRRAVEALADLCAALPATARAPAAARA